MVRKAEICAPTLCTLFFAIATCTVTSPQINIDQYIRRTQRKGQQTSAEESWGNWSHVAVIFVIADEAVGCDTAFKEGREKNMGTFGEPRGMYSAGLGWIGSTLVGGVW